LKRSRAEPAPDLVATRPITIPKPNAHVHEAHHVASHVGHRKAPLIDLDQFVVERFDDRVDHDGQRNGWLVRIARVLRHFNRRDAHQFADLRRSNACPVRIVHGVDQVVDQLLDRG